jgi:hypothetical protein
MYRVPSFKSFLILLIVPIPLITLLTPYVLALRIVVLLSIGFLIILTLFTFYCVSFLLFFQGILPFFTYLYLFLLLLLLLSVLIVVSFIFLIIFFLFFLCFFIFLFIVVLIAVFLLTLSLFLCRHFIWQQLTKLLYEFILRINFKQLLLYLLRPYVVLGLELHKELEYFIKSIKVTSIFSSSKSAMLLKIISEKFKLNMEINQSTK